MGRGNWCLSHSETYELVYVELQDVCETVESDDVEFLYKDFYDYVFYCLPSSYTKLSLDRMYMRDGGRSRDEMVMAYNGFFEIVMDSQGDWWHQGLAVVLKESAPAFARPQLEKTAAKLFAKLSEVYELSVRTSAWTSAPYQPTAEVA